MILVYVHQSCPTVIGLSGDIEENPGPKRYSNQSFSSCHWNFNSITANNYLKISANNYLKTTILKYSFSLHNFDKVCILETFLASTTALDDENLELTGYNLLRADHASTSKKVGVCVYYKS